MDGPALNSQSMIYDTLVFACFVRRLVLLEGRAPKLSMKGPTIGSKLSGTKALTVSGLFLVRSHWVWAQAPPKTGPGFARGRGGGVLIGRHGY